MKDCPNCGKPVKKGKTGIYFNKETIKINPVKAYQCESCGEEYIDESEYERLREKVKALKIIEKKEKIKKIHITI